MCSVNCGWLKETFGQYVTIHGLDKSEVEIAAGHQIFPTRK